MKTTNFDLGGYPTPPCQGAVRAADVKDGDILTNPSGKQFKLAVGHTTDTTVDIGICMLGGINELMSWATVPLEYYLNGCRT